LKAYYLFKRGKQFLGASAESEASADKGHPQRAAMVPPLSGGERARTKQKFSVGIFVHLLAVLAERFFKLLQA